MLRSLAAALVLLGVTATTAAAAPTPGPVFDLPAKPGYLHGTADGGAWVAVNGTEPADAVRIQPDGTVQAFALAGVTGAYGITTGPDGDVWVTTAGAVARFTPGAPGATPATKVPIAGLDPRSITTGPDGSLWTASDDTVHRITPAGAVTGFEVAGTSFRGIVAGPDALYVADSNGTIVKLTTAGVSTQLPSLPGLQEVALDAAGNLAATQPVNAPQVVQLRTPAVRDVPLAVDPFGIVAAPDGAFWVAGFNSTTLTRMTPEGATSTVPLAAAANDPRYLTVAGQGRLYVGLEQSQQVQRIDGVTAPVAPEPTPTPTPDPQPTPTPAPQLGLSTTAKRAIKPGRPVVRVRLDVAGTGTFVLERRAAGRRKGGRCVKPGRARRGARCVRWVRVQRRAGVALAAGAETRVAFRRVGTGRYRVRVRATGGEVTERTTVAFRVRRSVETHAARRPAVAALLG